MKKLPTVHTTRKMRLKALNGVEFPDTGSAEKINQPLDDRRKNNAPEAKCRYDYAGDKPFFMRVPFWAQAIVVV